MRRKRRKESPNKEKFPSCRAERAGKEKERGKYGTVGLLRLQPYGNEKIKGYGCKYVSMCSSEKREAPWQRRLDVWVKG